MWLGCEFHGSAETRRRICVSVSTIKFEKNRRIEKNRGRLDDVNGKDFASLVESVDDRLVRKTCDIALAKESAKLSPIVGYSSRIEFIYIATRT